MRLGIIGLPQSGKTTIFNALTREWQQQAGIAWRFAQPALTNGCAAARGALF
jgi:ribosome-binding ATPase YchF (GTP1/OBG family)